MISTVLEFDRSVIAFEKFLYDLKDIFFYLYNYILTIICYFDIELNESVIYCTTTSIL